MLRLLLQFPRRLFGVLREVVASLLVFAGRLLWPLVRRVYPPVVPDPSGRPVLFIPGYFKNPSVFWWIVWGLRGAGWRNLVPVELPRPWRAIEEQARDVARAVDRTLERTGAREVDLVAHSMGGLTALYYLSRLGGGPKVRNLVQLAVPARGTYVAYAGVGPCARQMRPGSPFLRDLDGTGPHGTRIHPLWSDLDELVIPHASAAGGDGRGFVENLGHAGILFSRRVLARIRESLSPS